MKATEIQIGTDYAYHVGNGEAKRVTVKSGGWKGRFRVAFENGRLIDVSARSLLNTWDRWTAGEKTPPQPEPENTQNAGTCLICCAVYKVDKAKKLVLHGYTRPGWGCIQGRCTAVGMLPYELGTEALEAYRPQVVGFINRRTADLDYLNAGQFDSLEYTGSRYNGQGKREAYTVTVQRGDRGNNSPRCGDTYPSFDALLNARIHDAEVDIRHATAELQRVDELIRDWQPRDLVYKK